MNVSELITKLKKMPQNAEVFFKDQGTDQESYDSVDNVTLKRKWEGHEDFVALTTG